MTNRDPELLEARYVAGYTLWLRFRDGVEGEIDLASELRGEMFEPLRDLEVFRTFFVDPEFATLVWPNGADLAPEFLYRHVQMSAHSKPTHRPSPSR